MRQKDFTKISKAVKEAVWERDGGRCVVCGSGYAEPNSHVVRRSQGGLGVAENIVTHCRACHQAYDEYRKPVIEKTMEYIQSIYPDWEKERMKYTRWKK